MHPFYRLRNREANERGSWAPQQVPPTLVLAPWLQLWEGLAHAWRAGLPPLFRF